MQLNGTGNIIDFSVVVPAYNAERTLASCLDSLLAQTLPKEKFEVIVVDDGSTDTTSKIARRFDVRYLFQKNMGPATARNTGARNALGQFILFTDADCAPAPDWLAEMVRPFTHQPDVSAVKGSYKTTQKELAARFAQMEFEDRYDMLSRNYYIDMVDSYSAAFRKEVFIETGGFDECFPKANNEDTELSYRLADAGYRMVFNPCAYVFHNHPATLLQYLKVKLWRGYWRMIVYSRYPLKAVKDSYTPNVLKLQTMLMAVSFFICLMSLFIPIYFTLVFLIWFVVMILALPFSIKTYKKDKMVGLISPGVILLRSMVFAAGSLMGVVRNLISRLGTQRTV